MRSVCRIAVPHDCSFPRTYGVLRARHAQARRRPRVLRLLRLLEAAPKVRIGVAACRRETWLFEGVFLKTLSR